ncbi:MAG TPA: hypothetical protein VNH40_06665 [Gaiellaceae bacterium]|nr:hypothetical protein [Gaiellaceae bacterium]
MKPAVSQEPAAPPAASVEPEADTEIGIEIETQAEPEVEAQAGIEFEAEFEAEAITVGTASQGAVEAEQAAETEDGSRAAGLPIHLWVQVPGANGGDANPDWPQELVREGLERSLRARDRSRDRD